MEGSGVPRAWRSPQALLAGGFLGCILAGTLLLRLPWCHTGRVPIGWGDAAFTATSAVCVTGLVVRDTALDFNPFGQFVILLLIQVGGLGIMTFAAAAVDLLHGRLSLRSAAALQDTLLQQDAARDVRRLFWRVLRFTFAIELAGALVLLVPWWVYGDPEGGGAPAAVWHALFHAVSAFCNAGFALQSDSLMGFRTNGWVLAPVMMLIVLGGLGYTVLIELWAWLTRREHQPPVRFSVHTRVVLWMSGGLLVGGWLIIAFFGTAAEAGTGTRLVDAAFQSVTARTAGFNTVPMGGLPAAALFVMCLLMFVGGSPGSTAGGVKTTTVAIAVAEMRAGLRDQQDVHLGDRRLPTVVVRRALLLLGVAVAWNLLGVLVLLVSEPGVNLEHLVFEQVSALGTVGLSADLTPKLSGVGRCWIMLSMFMGRVGPLTIGVWVTPRPRGTVRYPEGKVMIG